MEFPILPNVFISVCEDFFDFKFEGDFVSLIVWYILYIVKKPYLFCICFWVLSIGTITLLLGWQCMGSERGKKLGLGRWAEIILLDQGLTGLSPAKHVMIKPFEPFAQSQKWSPLFYLVLGPPRMVHLGIKSGSQIGGLYGIPGIKLVSLM